jgi:LmbE family N-acetylglucosaminyl deacetylase
MEVFGRSHDTDGSAAACASAAVSLLGREAAACEQGELARPRDAGRRADAGLDVLVGRLQPVRPGVVVAHVHPGASGDQSHARISASGVEACSTSSDAGYDCQKFLMLTPRPPVTSPAKTSPEARLPAPAKSHVLCALVRFMTVKPSAFGCTSLKPSQTGQSARRFWLRVPTSSMLGTRLPAIWSGKTSRGLPPSADPFGIPDVAPPAPDQGLDGLRPQAGSLA